MSRCVTKPGTTGYYPTIPGTIRYYRQGNLREQSPGSLRSRAYLHNSVALYRYLRVTPSLTIPLTTMH
eukprot:682918-Amorphochlora_amoeboformis.AAC.1